MPNLTEQFTWQLTLDNAELLLVLKALGGRLTPDRTHELAAARTLGDKLTALRAGRLKSLERTATRLQSVVEPEKSDVDAE